MKNKSVKDVGKSILAKLLNCAKQSNIDFNRILLLYFQERFLHRLSISEYCDRLILKGGVLFYGAHLQNARPTRDIDFLGRNFSNNADSILLAIQQIAKIKVNDGVVFDVNEIKLMPITQTAEYEGIRIKIPIRLDSAIQNLQVDIGFGDWISPAPKSFDFPLLLDSNSFSILAYSWESVIAEKFEAIVKFSYLNSRLKDFYDIYFLLTHHNFDGRQLKNAISKTFQCRQTDIKLVFEIFSNTFKNDEMKQTQWKAFLRKLEISFSIPFPEMMSNLQQFLHPIVDAILKDADFSQIWDCEKFNWYIDSQSLGLKMEK